MFMCALISSIKTVVGTSILKATDLKALVRKALGVFWEAYSYSILLGQTHNCLLWPNMSTARLSSPWVEGR